MNCRRTDRMFASSRSLCNNDFILTLSSCNDSFLRRRSKCKSLRCNCSRSVRTRRCSWYTTEVCAAKKMQFVKHIDLKTAQWFSGQIRITRANYTLLHNVNVPSWSLSDDTWYLTMDEGDDSWIKEWSCLLVLLVKLHLAVRTIACTISKKMNFHFRTT